MHKRGCYNHFNLEATDNALPKLSTLLIYQQLKLFGLSQGPVCTWPQHLHLIIGNEDLPYSCPQILYTCLTLTFIFYHPPPHPPLLYRYNHTFPHPLIHPFSLQVNLFTSQFHLTSVLSRGPPSSMFGKFI